MADKENKEKGEQKTYLKVITLARVLAENLKIPGSDELVFFIFL